MAASRPPVNLDSLIERVRHVAPEPLPAFLWSDDDGRALACKALALKGVRLLGDPSLVEHTIRREIEDQRSTIAAFQAYVAAVEVSRKPGRPRRYCALRDLFVAGISVFFRDRVPVPPRRRIKTARIATARVFGLTADTQFVRSRELSADQVRWAEERTERRFLAYVAGGPRRQSESAVTDILFECYLAAVDVAGAAQEPFDDYTRRRAERLVGFAYLLEAADVMVSPETRHLIKAVRQSIPDVGARTPAHS